MKHVLYAVLSGAFLALAAPAAAQEHVKAEYVQEHVSCKEMGGYAKDGECYRCPASHPTRTLSAGDGPKACKRKSEKTFVRAERHEEPTGFPKIVCKGRESYYSPKLKWCMRCPPGAERTIHALSGGKACERKTEEAFARAVHLGKRGCPEGTFKSLGGKCYRCPEGYKRNLRVGPYQRIKACTIDMDKEALKARWEQSKDDRPGTRSRTEAVLRDYEANYYDPNGGGQGLENLTPALNVIRRDKAIKILNEEAAEEDDPYTTVVWTSEGGLSVGLGFSLGTGFAIHRTDEQDADGKWIFECQQVNVRTFQLGPLAEAGFGDSVSLERGDLDAVPGSSHGYFVTAGVFVYGGMVGQEWDRDTGARAFVWGLGMGKGGAGAAWGWTRTTAKDTFDCDEIEKISEPD